MINDPISIFKELGLNPHAPIEDFYNTILQKYRDGTLTSKEIKRIERFAGKDIFYFLENEWDQGKNVTNMQDGIATAV